MRRSEQMIRTFARCILPHRPAVAISKPYITNWSLLNSSEGLDVVVPSQTRVSTSAADGFDAPSLVRVPNLLQRDLQSAFQQRRGFLSVGDGDEESDRSRHHEEHRLIGYSPQQMYAVVAAVDLYEDFVPWCQKSRIIWHKPNDAMEAELEIGFKFFLERYISHVELKPPHSIKTSVSQSSLFDYLINIWEFKPGPTPHSCNLHFLVEFQFRSPLYRKVANMFFNEVVQKLVQSFEQRCKAVYGPSIEVAKKS